MQEFYYQVEESFESYRGDIRDENRRGSGFSGLCFLWSQASGHSGWGVESISRQG